jgi:hypothetical protein
VAPADPVGWIAPGVLGGTSLLLFALAVAVAAVLFVLGALFAVTIFLLFLALILWFCGLILVTIINAVGLVVGLLGTAASVRKPAGMAITLPGVFLNGAALAGELCLLISLLWPALVG